MSRKKTHPLTCGIGDERNRLRDLPVREICEILTEIYGDLECFKDSFTPVVYLSDKGLHVSAKSFLGVSMPITGHDDGFYATSEIREGVLYLLGLQTDQNQRGKGHGTLLLERTQLLAETSLCKRVVLTPSGWSYGGRPKWEYYSRRGFQKINDIEMARPVRNWYVYIIECQSGTLYVGVTNDLEKRFQLHASGRGSRYVKSQGGPKRYIYQRMMPSKEAAMSKEQLLKRLSHKEKRDLAGGVGVV